MGETRQQKLIFGWPVTKCLEPLHNFRSDSDHIIWGIAVICNLNMHIYNKSPAFVQQDIQKTLKWLVKI